MTPDHQTSVQENTITFFFPFTSVQIGKNAIISPVSACVRLQLRCNNKGDDVPDAMWSEWLLFPATVDQLWSKIFSLWSLPFENKGSLQSLFYLLRCSFFRGGRAQQIIVSVETLWTKLYNMTEASSLYSQNGSKLFPSTDLTQGFLAFNLENRINRIFFGD